MALPALAALDEALEIAGEDVIIRRIYGQAPRTNNVDVTVRAAVRTFQPSELLGGIAQTDSKVIVSPTDITAAQWPGGEMPSPTVADPTIPKITDRIVIQGRVRTIAVVQPIYMEDESTGLRELVRIEMRVLG
jgi:hypothetical protein